MSMQQEQRTQLPRRAAAPAALQMGILWSMSTIIIPAHGTMTPVEQAYDNDMMMPDLEAEHEQAQAHGSDLDLELSIDSRRLHV